jgi:hypothetical protein
MVAHGNGVVESDEKRGGVVRMATEFHVARPADEAFDFWTDVRNELRYNPSAVRVEQTTPGGVGLGTAWAGDYKGMGPLTLSVVVYDRPHYVVRRGRARAFEFASFLRFEPTDSGTHVIARGELAFRGLFRLLGPLLKPMLDREFARTMATFKQAAEDSQ